MCTVCGCSGGASASSKAVESDGHEDGHHHHHHHDHDHVHAVDGALDFSANAAGASVPGQTPARLIEMERAILSANDERALANRARFADAGVTALNIMSSPGSGKTTLLVETLKALYGRLPVAVIEGDQHTSADAARIRETGAPAVQINTGKGCHLDAAMIGSAMNHLPPVDGGIVFIENVGNLVCPAGFDLGETRRVVLACVTEGEDKPLKYPEMFARADLMVVSKMDLAPHLDADVDALIANAQAINPTIETLAVSVRGAPGIGAWLGWLEALHAPVRTAAE